MGDTSEQAPALASWKNRLYLAWKGSGNDNLNLMFTHGDGKTFAGKTTFGDTSHHAPALAVHNDIIFLAWTGRGDGNLNVAKVGITPNSTFVLVDKVVLSDTAEEGPALASHNGRLFLAWKGSGNDNLNLIFSDDDGLSFHGKTTFGDTSHYAPALASHDGRLYLAWTGRGDGNLNVASVALFGNTAGGFGIDSLEAKVVLGDTSECAPGLASSNGRLFLAWKGAGNDDLNLLSSRDGSFQSGPWCFGDFGKYGFYVAAYRTPPAHPDQLDTPLENLGLLFAMESHKPDGQETMSFKTFYQSIRDLNAGLPAALEYGGNYSFRAPDGRRYEFWLHPSLDKYQARIVMDGEPNPVQDLTTLPLVEGPYLRSPGGHLGYIEVYYPGCPTPLVLDFRDPLSPVRVDNIGACPQPWVDRAEALLAFADRLSQAGRHAEELAALRDRVAIYRQLAAIDPAQYGPALAAALKDLAQRLLSLVSRQFNANQFAQMSPTAREAIDVYRQAIDAGAETSHIASNLTTLSSWLAQAGLAHESKLAATVAAELQK